MKFNNSKYRRKIERENSGEPFLQGMKSYRFLRDYGDDVFDEDENDEDAVLFGPVGRRYEDEDYRVYENSKS